MQEEIINSVLTGKDTLGILPTGGGKSLTFQVPGLALPGVVIVVTPLISLMMDQVDNLRKRGIKAVAINSGMSMRQRNSARERLFNDKAKFLYLSPERLGNHAFINEIRNLKVSLIVVDEAHCISQWGYDFRPSYLKIKKLRKTFPSTPVLALTASATKEVADDICLQLEFKKDAGIFKGGISRSNLSYVVRHSEAKLSDIFNILSSVNGSGIVYVRSRKRSREISDYLNNSGIVSSFYHAGLEREDKEIRQTEWKEGRIRVMVATNAFGMGIDKPDVRIVIHYDLPPSLEEYYQEAGRAGRDGLPAYAVLLIAKTDKAVLRRRITMEFPPKDVIKKIYTRLCVFSHIGIGEGYDKTVEFDMVRFCKVYNVEEKVVRPSLRILSQAGYADFLEDIENSSRIKILVERDELYRIKMSSPVHELILTSILRTYPGLFTDYVFINEKKISLMTQLEPQVIYEKLLDLTKAKIISYVPRKRTPLLYFPTAMEEERYVMIGRNVYEQRKEILSARIEAMIGYAFSDSACRQAILMEYFGEDAGQDCGRCDVCRSRKGTAAKKLDTGMIAHQLKKMFQNGGESYTDHDLHVIFGDSTDKALEILRDMRRAGEIAYTDGRWQL